MVSFRSIDALKNRKHLFSPSNTFLKTLYFVLSRLSFIIRDPLVLLVHRVLHGVRPSARHVQPRVDKTNTMENGDFAKLFHQVRNEAWKIRRRK
mmetsp:Transcript_17618/g.26375  ORF Transcript_17618/g.26375 Transcript_17618/m.26375 type:complete len:94 (-) Transcript_17618:1533-1814(-)